MFNLIQRYKRKKNNLNVNCNSTFAKEITVIIVIKLFLLYFIWWLCFSHPLSKTMVMDKEQFANTLFGLTQGR